MRNCPNVLDGAECVDPECTYCRIARAESPKPRPETETQKPETP